MECPEIDMPKEMITVASLSIFNAVLSLV